MNHHFKNNQYLFFICPCFKNSSIPIISSNVLIRSSMDSWSMRDFDINSPLPFLDIKETIIHNKIPEKSFPSFLVGVKIGVAHLVRGKSRPKLRMIEAPYPCAIIPVNIQVSVLFSFCESELEKNPITKYLNDSAACLAKPSWCMWRHSPGVARWWLKLFPPNLTSIYHTNEI